jgi:predicted transcriptional regulator
MVLSEIIELLDAEVHTGTDKMSISVKSACGADLMSDVMAFSKENAMLLTGLINPQVVRTAEMMDIQVIVFVRGKKPTPVMRELAAEKGIVLLSTSLSMFSACGVLYKAGIAGSGINCG